MKPPKHSSATSNHYDDAALDYDTFNEQNSRIINQIIEQILQKHSIQTVLDLTCGTGSQCFWLHQKGFKVHGIDISPAMLGIAKSKAATQNICIPFQLGDMRTSNIGVFDAALTIFNAIGHVTSADFKKTLHNIAENLRSGGLYIFDIFNLEYWLTDTHITNMTIDWIEKSKHRFTRKI